MFEEMICVIRLIERQEKTLILPTIADIEKGDLFDEECRNDR
jgi:hypothetical protein